MRAYFFGNMYLSPIQQGIQAAHVVGDMAVKYQRTGDGYTEQGLAFHTWAKDHKVMILLNAGYGENIQELESFFEGTLDDYPNVTPMSESYDGYSPYPFAMFCESEEALGGAATSFGVILPPKIYEGAATMRKVKRMRPDMTERLRWDNEQRLLVRVPLDGLPLGRTELVEYDYNAFEVELMERLGTFRLA